MQEIFEKIIEKLTEYMNLNNGLEDEDYFAGEISGYKKAMSIVQEAEEYATDTNAGNNGWIPVEEPYIPYVCKDTECPYNEEKENGCPAAEGCAGYKAEPQTNANRIYAMSVKELAKFLENVENLGYRDESIAGHKDMLEWLQSEVEE